jgi:ubiquitin-protein ligase
MNPRLMRLNSDYEKIRTEFVGHKCVKVEPIGGTMPPEKYIVTYRIPGLRLDSSGRPVKAFEHVAEIYLHADYPREKPKCTLRTPIFHPNFGPYICIGDHWAAGETLADIIVQIGDMIQYRSYNPKSPLNGEAARWAVQNKNSLPVGNIDLLQAEPDIDIGISSSAPEPEDDLGIVLGSAPKTDDLDIQLL